MNDFFLNCPRLKFWHVHNFHSIFNPINSSESFPNSNKIAIKSYSFTLKTIFPVSKRLGYELAKRHIELHLSMHLDLRQYTLKSCWLIARYVVSWAGGPWHRCLSIADPFQMGHADSGHWGQTCWRQTRVYRTCTVVLHQTNDIRSRFDASARALRSRKECTLIDS